MQEVAIADDARFGRELEPFAQVLAMLEQNAIAIVDIRLGHDAAAIFAQIVGAFVVDAVEVEQTGGRSAKAEEVFTLVLIVRPFGKPAQAEVAQGYVPIGSLGLVGDAK